MSGAIFKSTSVDENIAEMRKHRHVCAAGFERMANRDAYRCACGDEFWNPPSCECTDKDCPYHHGPAGPR